MRFCWRSLFLLPLPLLLGAALPPSADGDAGLYDRVMSDVDRLYWDKAKLGPGWADAIERNRPRALAARNARDLYGAIEATLATVGDSHVYAVDPDSVAIDRARERGEGRIELRLRVLARWLRLAGPVAPPGQPGGARRSRDRLAARRG